MLRPWALAPEPFSDELLSSWLSRVALKHVAQPTHFWRQEYKSPNLENDIDVYQPPGLLSFVAEKTSTPSSAVLSHTLNGLTKIYSLSPSKGCQWITRIGHGTSRALHGLSYCPQCFSESSVPYYRQAWRLAWVTGCPRHQCLLLDRCPHCNSAINPIWTPEVHERLGACFYCGGMLRETKTQACHPAALKFQQWLSNYLKTTKEDSDRKLFIEERLLLEGLRKLVRFFLPDLSRAARNELNFESLSIAERHQTLIQLTTQTRHWPYNLQTTKHRRRSIYTIAQECGVMPTWLLSAIDQGHPYRCHYNETEALWLRKHARVRGAKFSYSAIRRSFRECRVPVSVAESTVGASSLPTELQVEELIRNVRAYVGDFAAKWLLDIYEHETLISTLCQEKHLPFHQTCSKINRMLKQHSPIENFTTGRLRRAGVAHRKSHRRKLAAAQRLSWWLDERK